MSEGKHASIMADNSENVEKRVHIEGAGDWPSLNVLVGDDERVFFKRGFHLRIKDNACAHQSALSKLKPRKRGNLIPKNDDFVHDNVDSDSPPKRKCRRKLDANFIYGDELVDVGEPILNAGKVLTERKDPGRKSATPEATLEPTKKTTYEAETSAIKKKIPKSEKKSCESKDSGTAIPTVFERMRDDFGTDMSQCCRGFKRDDSAHVVPIEDHFIDAIFRLHFFTAEQDREVKVETQRKDRHRRAPRHEVGCRCCKRFGALKL